MKRYDSRYFQKIDFTEKQLAQFLSNAERDIHIVTRDDTPEVKFTYAYQALIKAGIALLAMKGSVRIRSVPGHHVKVLDELSQLLKDEDISIMGNAMRSKRNVDFYGGGTEITEKEAAEYCRFVQSIVEKVKKLAKFLFLFSTIPL